MGERLGGQIGEAEKRIAGQRATVMAGLEQMATDIAPGAYAKLAGQPADQSALAAKVAAAKGRQPMISTAWAADAAPASSIFSDPTFWVAVAFVLFFVLAGKLLWRQITGMLDKRAADIAKALADAERLRADALKAKADAEATLAKATGEADAIVQQAREEVTRMQARAAQQLETAVALREQQAQGPHRPGRGRRLQGSARHRRRRGARRHPRAAAGPGRLRPRPGAGRRGDRRAAAPPALAA